MSKLAFYFGIFPFGNLGKVGPKDVILKQIRNDRPEGGPIEHVLRDFENRPKKLAFDDWKTDFANRHTFLLNTLRSGSFFVRFLSQNDRVQAHALDLAQLSRVESGQQIGELKRGDHILIHDQGNQRAFGQDQQGIGAEVLGK